jgi:hypothetical protein
MAAEVYTVRAYAKGVDIAPRKVRCGSKSCA